MEPRSHPQLETLVDQDRLSRLRVAVGSGPVLILTHDNPDPDALASGKALATLLQAKWGIPSELVYSGVIARAENREVLSRLTPEWRRAGVLPDPSQYSALALVDTQPSSGNNRLPASLVPQVVLDHHHPWREALSVVPYADVRPELGATATLVYLYMEAAGLVPDALLATALFYGLQVDTRGLSRGASPIDHCVYLDLLSLLDRRELVRVEQAGLSREYFRTFNRGLETARIHGRAIVAYLGALHRPDLPAEMADILIRLDGASAALCLGHHDGVLHLSLRTEPMGQDAGLLVQEVVVPPGKAGGHGSMAGGQVPLRGQGLEDLVAEIERRFLAAMAEQGDGEPLLDPVE